MSYKLIDGFQLAFRFFLINLSESSASAQPVSLMPLTMAA